MYIRGTKREMDVIEQFLTYARYELNRSALTITAYRNDLAQLADSVAPSRDAAALSLVTTGDLRLWLSERAGVGDSARTLRRKLAACRALWRYLAKRGLVTGDPTRDIEAAKLPVRLPQWVRPATMDAVLDEPIDEGDFNAARDRLVVALLYETGIRRAELIGLKDAAVDNRRRELRVTGKRDKERVVPYGAELAAMIERWRALRDSELGVTTGGPLLVTRSGKALYPSLVWQIVNRRLRAAGATGQASPHVLRHSYASALLGDGAGLQSVKELLGHQSLAATQVYTHVTMRELQHNYQQAHPRASKQQ